ncbi:4-(cytidine 5'-diphospho)-2-C-methyl-D-erythritol kinase [Sphingobium sp. Sx8-8]|uniref:4-(cytidine 5'-diphospho)-2-C-methyl-D-erythritol kinase n=1 Tax=Sphingobium sp. Sx8-8 TaxID=2933617 RepID=UPI001F584A25|nr:4-(cytidine 5'-diphospho)-2-C-methyl-D-erythritol kinase [Sphingobium sp. Sx8-8]
MPHGDAELNPLTRTGELAETAYAKVNLALHVRHRRDDGYHALESLFVFAEHGDLLTGQVRPDGMLDLQLDGPFGPLLDAGPDNLVLKAARVLQAYIGEERGAALQLTKFLPVASGIGGGSADAAATLRLLVRLWDVPVEPDVLEGIALSLGSDVPACLSSVTQMVLGRGELLQRLTVGGLERMPMLLVNPGVGISTARIFAGWDQVDRGPLTAGDLDQLVLEGRNDLEAAAVAEAPVIAEVLEALQACPGVRLTRMSGSGATCFGLFATESARASAAEMIRNGHPAWWIAETRIRAA